jgi:8-amino-7-oxononanoate synthase
MARPAAKPQQRSGLIRRIDVELADLASEGQLRSLTNVEGVNLCSNDYLGLATDPRLRDAVAAALAAQASVASTGSRLLSGNSNFWEELEWEIARFMQSQAALFFSSGYLANLGLLSSVIRPGDIVFSDSANHASIIDGLRLSGAHKVIYPHLDLDCLERKLRNERSSAQKFIITESIFSMDGDRAPISELVDLAEKYGAELIVDEAHATGVAGPQGRGLVAAFRLSDRILATVHPCGKALASMGCFVVCSEKLKHYLVNRARTFIFSTALPPYIAAQVRAAMRITAASDNERNALAGLSAFLRRKLRDASFDIGTGDTQIVPIVLGENDRAVRFAGLLNDAGFGIRAIRPPSVPAGTSRLRISLNAKLSIDLLDRFVAAVVSVRDQEPVLVQTVRS